MIVKLQLGYLEPIKDVPKEIPNFLDRRVLVVYTGNHESMDGLVEVKDEHIERLAEVRNGVLSKVKRLASGDLPVHVCPPVQLDHSVKAVDTIGRVVGDYEVGEHTVEDGSKRKALYTTMRFLGKENVEKAMDGRYHHVSFGGDLEKGTTQEITVTPFPAAGDAQLLARLGKKTEKYKGHEITIEKGQGMDWYFQVKDHREGPFQKEEDALLQARQYVEGCITSEQLSQGEKMNIKRLKSYLMRVLKLSAEDADKKMSEMPETDKAKMAKEEEAEHAKMKKYLTGHKKMSDDDAEKHLSEMDVEKKKELSAEVDEHEKRMAAEAGHDAKMAAARASAVKLASDFRSSADKTRLAARKVTILTKLSQLKAEAKITPAEIKKIELDKLAGSNDATVDAVLKTYSDREPVVFTGVFGSRQGADISKGMKNARMSQLESETRANMPLMAKQMKDRMAAEGEHGKVKTEPGHQASEPVYGNQAEMSQSEAEEAHKMAHHHMGKVHAAMDAGKMDEAKEHLKHLMEHCLKHMRHPAHMAENEEAHKAGVEMSALAENAKTMQTKFEEAMALVSSLVGSEIK